MKKCLFIILIFLFVSGCSAEYNLNIRKGKITEEVNFTLDKSKFPEPDETLIETSLFSKQVLENIMYDDQFPVLENFEDKYEKTIDDKNGLVDVRLKYTYSENTYVNSKIISQCFEKVNVVETKKEIYIKLSGKYMCLTEENSVLAFNLSSSDKIVTANGERNSFNNYTWEINKNNEDKVDIEIRVLKQSIYFYYGIRIAIGIGVLALIVGIFIVVSRIRDKDRYNEV